MRHFATIALALFGAAPLAAAGLAHAQAVDEAPVVLRLSPDGDWLAAARGTTGSEAILVAPLNPVPRGAPAAALTIGGLFAVPGIDGPRVVASASRRQIAPVLAPALPANWCQGVVGLVANAAECALQAAPGLAPQPSLTRRSAGLAWSAGPLDLAAVASRQSGWTVGSLATLPASGSPPAGEAPDLLFPLGLGTSRDASLSGLWRVAPWGGVTLGATWGETRWQVLPGTAPLALDQAAVQIGLAYGPFSGGITGRTVRQASGAEPLWNGLDIGFAWRTPWRGELSIGAQNLIGRGTASGLPAPAAPALDEATARTPYVRYTQDL